MGMIANYHCIEDSDLKEILRLESEDDEEEVFEAIRDLNENTDAFLDIDKMWDVIHFILTGVSTDKPPKNNPLSEAVIGVHPLKDLSEFVAYVDKERVAAIVSALDNFDYESALEDFDAAECKDVGLYPNIWDEDDEDEIDELLEEIADYLEGFRDFYKKVLESGGNALITIY